MVFESAENGVSPETDASKSAGRAIARNAGHLVVGQAVTTVLAILLNAALGRSLGATDFGLLFLVTSMAQFAFVVVEWGQPHFVVREVAKDASNAGIFLGSALILRVAGTLLLAGAAVLGAWALGYDLRTRGLVALLMISMLPFVLAQAFSLIFRARERMEFESSVSMINKACVLGLTLAALGLGFGLEGAILSQGAAGLVALAAAVIFLRRLELPPVSTGSAGVRQILHGGAPIVVMNVAVAVQTYIDAVVLSKLGSAESIGWFGAAKVILGTLVAPAMILGSSAYPRLARAAHDPERLRSELHVAIRPVLGLAVLGAVGTFLYAGGAIRLIYGAASFEPAASILQVYAPGLLLLFLDILLANAVLATGGALAFAVGKIASIVASTGFSLLLVPACQERFGNGGIGIALAFGASEIIVLVVTLAILPRRTLSAATLSDAGRALVTGGITLAIFLALPPLPLLVGAPLCVLAFAALAMGTKLVRPSEIDSARSMMRRRWTRAEPE